MREQESDNLPPDASAGHERRDARVGPLLWAVGTLLAITAFLQVLLIGMMWVFEQQEQQTDPQPSPVAQVKEPVEPMLQPTLEYHERSPAMDLKAMQERDRQILENYGWVDRDKGIVRIPIEVAMQKLLDQSRAGVPSPAIAPKTQEGRP